MSYAEILAEDILYIWHQSAEHARLPWYMVTKVNQSAHTIAPCRMDGSWTGNTFMLYLPSNI